jgi:hypothetical protein
MNWNVKWELRLLWEKKKDQKNYNLLRIEKGNALVMKEEEWSKERWLIEKWNGNWNCYWEIKNDQKNDDQLRNKKRSVIEMREEISTEWRWN